MIRTVYVDILFLINFSMDFFCFYLVSVLLCRPFSPLRMVIASAVGGIYAVFSLFLPFSGILLLCCDAFACLLMCFMKEIGRPIRTMPLFREALIFTGVSMALGGVMTATYSMLNKMGIPEDLSKGSDGISAWIFLLLAVIGGGATLLGSRFFQRNASMKVYRVHVELCGREGEFLARIDTGNSVADPISGCPAAAIDPGAAEKLLPELQLVDFRHPGDCISQLPEALRARVRLLPVVTVTGEGLLLAFRIDHFTVTESAMKKEGEECRVLLAVSPTALDGTDMLLPPSIFISGGS